MTVPRAPRPGEDAAPTRSGKSAPTIVIDHIEVHKGATGFVVGTPAPEPPDAAAAAMAIQTYLSRVRDEAGRLPPYFPEDLRALGWRSFPLIRQRVEVVRETQGLDRFILEEQERTRTEGGEDQLYDPLRARPGVGHDLAISQRQEAFPHTEEWTPEFAERVRRGVILGDPGFGKTWLLRHEALRLASAGLVQLEADPVSARSVLLPLPGSLPALASANQPLEAGLLQGVGEPMRGLVERALDDGRCVVLLDGLDEVPRTAPEGVRSAREDLLERIADFCRRYPRSRVLLGCRLSDYDPPAIPELQELVLLAFQRGQIETFVRAFLHVVQTAERLEPPAQGDHPNPDTFLASLDAIPQLAALARIPLMLALLCSTYATDATRPIPSQRSRIYADCVRRLLIDHERSSRLRRRDYELEGWFDVLPRLAWDILLAGEDPIAGGRLVRLLGHLTEVLPDRHRLCRDPESLLDELVRRGILILVVADPSRASAYTFLNRSFHEYLAARDLARAAVEDSAAVERLVDENAFNPKFEQVFVLACGVLADDEVFLYVQDEPVSREHRLATLVAILRVLAAKERDDWLHHRLALAALALAELPESVLRP